MAVVLVIRGRRGSRVHFWTDICEELRNVDAQTPPVYRKGIVRPRPEKQFWRPERARQ